MSSTPLKCYRLELLLLEEGEDLTRVCGHSVHLPGFSPFVFKPVTCI